MLAWQCLASLPFVLARKRQQKVPPRISDQQKLLRDYGLLSTFKELQKEQRVCHNNTAECRVPEEEVGMNVVVGVAKHGRTQPSIAKQKPLTFMSSSCSHNIPDSFLAVLRIRHRIASLLLESERQGDAMPVDATRRLPRELRRKVNATSSGEKIASDESSTLPLYTYGTTIPC